MIIKKEPSGISSNTYDNEYEEWMKGQSPEKQGLNKQCSFTQNEAYDDKEYQEWINGQQLNQ